MTRKQTALLTNMTIFTSCLVIFVAILFYEQGLNKRTQENTTILHNNWLVTINNKNYTPESLTKFVFPSDLKKGDEIILSTVVPNFSDRYPVLIFNSSYSIITVYSGSTILYEYGKEFINKYNVGEGIHKIPLDKLNKDRHISIHLTLTANSPFKSILPMFVISADKVSKKLISNQILMFGSSLFLVVGGFLGIIIAIFTLIQKKRAYSILTACLFAMWTGIFVICQSNLSIIFSENLIGISHIKFTAPFIMTISMTIFFILQIARTKTEKIIAEFGIVLTFIAYVITLTLELTNNIPYIYTYKYVSLIFILMIIFGIVVSIRRIIYENTKKAISAFGFLIMLFFCAADYARYSLLEHSKMTFSFLYSCLISIGATIFLITAVINYLQNYAAFGETANEFKDIEGFLGKEDFVEKIENLNAMQKQKNNSSYGILSFGVEYPQVKTKAALSKVNLAIALCMKKIFGYYGYCSGLSKGHFVVAMPEIPEAKMQQLIKMFLKLLDKQHVTDFCQISYGYGFSYETSTDKALNVCVLAENRHIVYQQIE